MGDKGSFKNIITILPHVRLYLGPPGLVVMGGDSRPRSCGFESWHQILDEHFSHSLLYENAMFVWKNRK